MASGHKTLCHVCHVCHDTRQALLKRQPKHQEETISCGTGYVPYHGSDTFTRIKHPPSLLNIQTPLSLLSSYIVLCVASGHLFS